jgi:hypothetical protein
LGKAYTFSGLQKYRGVSYDKGRDNALIEALMQPQNLAIAPSEAEENELESSQSELVAGALATSATANELELSQSELAATAPATSATANELALSQSELETTAPATSATANELALSQSELETTAPATSATANELELQLSILPERNETSVGKSAIASRSRVQFTFRVTRFIALSFLAVCLLRKGCLYRTDA